jgi:RNA polymerase sigma-32 factor
MPPSTETRPRQYPYKDVRLLTREEETELAVRYRETHDPDLARRLVESHLRLVVKIARDCCSRKNALQDVIQEGCLGLMRAVEKFDPDRGIRLSSYAAWWIRAYVYQYLMANSRMIKVATTFAQRKVFYNLNRESGKLEREGRAGDSKELAARLGVSEKTVVEMRARLGGREVQFETTVAADSGPGHEPIDGRAAPDRPDEIAEDQQIREAVQKRIVEIADTLDARERAILEERLLADSPITLRDLGDRFGISRERARQLEDRLKKRLRPMLMDLRDEGGGQSTPPTELAEPVARAA